MVESQYSDDENEITVAEIHLVAPPSTNNSSLLFKVIPVKILNKMKFLGD